MFESDMVLQVPLLFGPIAAIRTVESDRIGVMSKVKMKSHVGH
jgi:hypothetical protein